MIAAWRAFWSAFWSSYDEASGTARRRAEADAEAAAIARAYAESVNCLAAMMRMDASAILARDQARRLTTRPIVSVPARWVH